MQSKTGSRSRRLQQSSSSLWHGGRRSIAVTRCGAACASSRHSLRLQLSRTTTATLLTPTPTARATHSVLLRRPHPRPPHLRRPMDQTESAWATATSRSRVRVSTALAAVAASLTAAAGVGMGGLWCFRLRRTRHSVNKSWRRPSEERCRGLEASPRSSPAHPLYRYRRSARPPIRLRAPRDSPCLQDLYAHVLHTVRSMRIYITKHLFVLCLFVDLGLILFSTFLEATCSYITLDYRNSSGAFCSSSEHRSIFDKENMNRFTFRWLVFTKSVYDFLLALLKQMINWMLLNGTYRARMTHLRSSVDAYSWTLLVH